MLPRVGEIISRLIGDPKTWCLLAGIVLSGVVAWTTFSTQVTANTADIVAIEEAVGTLQETTVKQHDLNEVNTRLGVIEARTATILGALGAISERVGAEPSEPPVDLSQ